jgi:type III pantothenate kinase
MTDIVVDIGNSRIKWGRVEDGRLADSVALPHSDPGAWDQQLMRWDLRRPRRWVVAGVNPSSQQMLLAWIQARGDIARVLERAAELPLVVRIPEPDRAGIDRLLAAVGANVRRAVFPAERPAVIVGVGTAITVDLIDRHGAFLGGAIMPGPRLLALALHEHTALLPLIEAIPSQPETPGVSTRAAIELGLHWAMAGGVHGLIEQLAARLDQTPEAVDVFVMGGGASLILHRLPGRVHHCPVLVLEGIARVAEDLS